MVYKALGSDGFMSLDGDGGKFRLGCWRTGPQALGSIFGGFGWFKDSGIRVEG